MKTLKVFYIAILSILLYSCSKEEQKPNPINNPPVSKFDIFGTYKGTIIGKDNIDSNVVKIFNSCNDRIQIIERSKHFIMIPSKYFNLSGLDCYVKDTVLCYHDTVDVNYDVNSYYIQFNKLLSTDKDSLPESDWNLLSGYLKFTDKRLNLRYRMENHRPNNYNKIWDINVTMNKL